MGLLIDLLQVGSSMKIALNLLPLKTGGGVQVALDFLRWVPLLGQQHQWFLACRKGSVFSTCTGSNVQIMAEVADNLSSRLWFEYVDCRKFASEWNIDAVFTLFGPQWPGFSGLNIVGCAYSNLFYPEIDFWGRLPLWGRQLKKVIDWQRLQRLHQADIRIFETDDLAQRAVSLFGYHPAATHVVRPACSSLVSEGALHQETRAKCQNLPVGFRVLLVAGYHPNKNIDLLVRTAAVLKARGVRDFSFVLTLPVGSEGEKCILDLAHDLGVSQHIHNVGTVPQQGCAELYRVCDVAVLPSTLESFSNMIAESWAMKTPLLISDLSWARALCRDGALYFTHNDAGSLADELMKLMQGEVDIAGVIQSGCQRLAQYPTSQQRFLDYLSIIEKAIGQREQPCTAS